MTAAAATDSSPVTLAQRGSIGRLLARIQSINPAIKNIWVADSEFHSEFRAPGSELMDGNGGHQVPVCFVFHNPMTGETIEQFYRPGESIPPCPISLGPDALLVAFAATAELKTMLRLWRRMSARILDLDIEWRHLNNEEHRLDQMKNEAKSANKNGDVSPMSLLGACAVNGIVTRPQEHKDAMRKLILGAGPWTPTQVREILDYCAEDVWDTTALLAAMWEKIQDTFYCRQRIDGLKAALAVGSAFALKKLADLLI